MNTGYSSLGQVADFINGFPFGPDEWGSAGLPIIRIQNLTNPDKPFTRTVAVVADKYRVNKGDLLVSWSATLGVFEWSREECGLVNQHIFRVVPNDQVAFRPYLKHVIAQAITAMARFSHGSTMRHINREEFLNTRIWLPKLEEQKRIAAILDKADAIRRKREQAIKLADEFLRSLFLDMFGDPIRNPKGWPMVEIGDISLVSGGLQVTPARSTNPLEFPYLRVANVYRDRLDLTEIKTIRVTESEFRRTTLTQGDLLLVEGHGNREEIGRCSVWSGAIGPCLHQNHLIRVRLNHRAEPHFVCATLNSASGRRQLIRQGKTTSGLNTISTSNVKSVRIFLPPVDLQQEFAKAKAGLAKIRLKQGVLLSEQNTICGVLSGRAFRGEV